MIELSSQEFENVKNKRLIPSFTKRGLINRIYPETWTADVVIIGGNQPVVKNIPLSSSIPSGVQVGDKCRVDMFDESNPNDMVVAYIYGRKIKSKFSSGQTTVGTGGSTIAHGLGAIPDVIVLNFGATPYTTNSVSITVTEISSPFAVSQGSNNIPITDEVYQYQAADDTYIYLKTTLSNQTVNWYTLAL